MLEFNLKEERAGKAIMELQDKLREALDDKKEIEIEFVALKKNYLNLNGDLDQERARNDNIGAVNNNPINRTEVSIKAIVYCSIKAPVKLIIA